MQCFYCCDSSNPIDICEDCFQIIEEENFQEPLIKPFIQNNVPPKGINE